LRLSIPEMSLLVRIRSISMLPVSSPSALRSTLRTYSPLSATSRLSLPDMASNLSIMLLTRVCGTAFIAAMVSPRRCTSLGDR